MSIGARPLGSDEVRRIIERKMADFHQHAAHIHVRYLEPQSYFDAAREDPDVRFALETGFIEVLEDEWRDPVLVSLETGMLYTCPRLVLRVLRDEPPEIHRPFVEGAFIRKLFRFFVPAAQEGGPSWEATEQVREIMQRHFPLPLVVTETLLDRAS